jgi:biotin carboxylase
VPVFELSLERPPEQEAARFRAWSTNLGLAPEHFCNHDEGVQRQVHAFAAALGLPALTPAQVQWVTDKLAMKEVFSAAGLACARFAPITDIDTVEKFAERIGWPVVVKPVCSGSSVDVWKFDDGQSAQIRKLLTGEISRRQWMVEEFIDGTEYQLCVLVHRGTVLDAYVARNPLPMLTAMDRGMNADITLAPSEEKPIDAVAVSQRLVDVLGYGSGSLHAEFFIRRDGGPVMGEIAARLGAAGLAMDHSLAYGFDMLSTVADLYVGLRPDLRYSRDRSVGDLLLPVRKGYVSEVSSMSELAGLPGVMSGEIQVKVGDLVNPPRTSSTCAGYVHVEGATSAEVEMRMTRVLDLFHMETIPA